MWAGLTENIQSKNCAVSSGSGKGLDLNLDIRPETESFMLTLLIVISIRDWALRKKSNFCKVRTTENHS